MTDNRRLSLIKPTINTRFHIDFDWWIQSDNDWRVFLQSLLCAEHQQAFSEVNPNVQIDWVDPETAEIQRVDGLQNILINHCAQQPGFITAKTTLVDSVFRVFLANGNEPMTPQQLSEKLNRPPATILATLSGRQVYRGIRPLIG